MGFVRTCVIDKRRVGGDEIWFFLYENESCERSKHAKKKWGEKRKQKEYKLRREKDEKREKIYQEKIKKKTDWK